MSLEMTGRPASRTSAPGTGQRSAHTEQPPGAVARQEKGSTLAVPIHDPRRGESASVGHAVTQGRSSHSRHGALSGSQLGVSSAPR